MTERDRRRERMREEETQNIKNQRRLNDLLYNLSEENMPDIYKKVENYQEKTKQAIADIRQLESDNEARINALTQWSGETDTAMAEIALSAQEAGAQVSLVAQNGTIKAAAIVAAINGQSSASISADRINFSGFTTFVRPSDIGANGSTTIDGGRIATGTISTDKLAKNSSFAIEFCGDIFTRYAIMFSDGYDIIGSIYAGTGSSVHISTLGGFYANDGFVISDAYINSYIDARLAYHNLIHGYV